METASAASQGSSAPSTSSASSQSSTPSTPQSSGQKTQTQPQSSKPQGSSSQPNLELVENDGQTPESQAEEFEEVSLGATKGKVPKQIAQAMKEYQRGVNQKFQEIARMRQAAQQNPIEFLKSQGVAIKDNPQLAKRVLSELGADPYTVSEALLAEKLEEMALSPEAKRVKELELENQKYRDSEKTKVERENAEKQRVAEAKASETLRTETIDAWRESGLPPHAQFGAQIAHVMLASVHQSARELMQEGYSKEQAMSLAQEKALSPKDAAAKVKKNFTSFTAEIFAGLPAQEIQKILGDETMKKLRDYDVARVTGQASQAQDVQKRPSQALASGNQSKSKQSMSEQEFREWNEKFIASLKD